MSVIASAPGKLLLFGEYAVLDGAPALVAAVNRRAGATIEPHPGSDIRVLAADLDIEARATISRGGDLRWDADESTVTKLHLVETVLRAAYRDAAQHERGVIPGGATATLSTAAFFDTSGAKLGLGSSAALTVALTGALRRRLGLPAPTLPDLVRLHRDMQGGRGSGFDVAAALTGGVLVYTGGDGDAPAAEPVSLPTGLHWCCVFTGRSTSTPRMLGQFHAWRQASPAAFRARVAELTGIARAGCRAVRGGDPAGTLAAFGAYADGLHGLGRDAGIDIVSAEHREIRNAAARCGVLYKPSGAGGGDIGIGFARDPNHIDALRRALSPRGYRMIDVAVDPWGLTVSGG